MSRDWRKSMVVLLLTVICLITCSAAADNASRVSFYQQYRGAVEADDDTYGKFTRGYWDVEIAQRYDGLEVAQNPKGKTRYLSNRGCRLFSYAHAIQRLTGEKASATRQLELIAELLRVNDDPPNAKLDYAAHVVKKYQAEHGVKDVTSSLAMTWEAAKKHFDNGGVILFNSGGHIALAVDYTEREISGKVHQLILLIDSSPRSTARRVKSGASYNSDFSKTYSRAKSILPGWYDYGRLWIRFSDFTQGTWQSAFTSTTAKKLTAPKQLTVDATLRIAVTTKETTIRDFPAESGKAVNTVASGVAISTTGAVRNNLSSELWYKTTSGDYLCSSDVKVYEYKRLCVMAGVFTSARAADCLSAPDDAAPLARSVSAGGRVTVTRLVTSSAGDIWAQLSDDSFLPFYRKASGEQGLKFVKLTKGFTLVGVQAPSGSLSEGAKFGLRGEIEAEAPIYSVRAAVIDRERAVNAIEPVTAYPDSGVTSVNLNAKVNDVNINTSMTFGDLETGWYRYQVSVQLGLTYNGAKILIGALQPVITSDFSIGTPETEEPAPGDITVRLPGDANDNGSVGIRDAIAILNYCAGEDVAISKPNADVNGDGKVDIQDALRLLQHDAGWKVELE